MTLTPSDFAVKVAATLVAAMIKGSAAWLRKKLQAGDIAKALEAAVAEALERALEAQQIADETLAGHYQGLLANFFAREAVGEELARLLDPSPEAELDLEALRAELDESGFDRDPEHLPGFDLEAFLLAFARAFWVAAGKQPALQGALQIQLLGSIRIGLSRVGDNTARIADATERGAEAEEKNTALLAAIHGTLDELRTGVLLAAIRAEARQGFISAVRGFEFFLAELRRAGYTLEISRAGEVLLPEAKGDKLLPPGPRGEVLEAAAELRQAITGHAPSAAELDELEAHYRRHLVDWFKSLEFRGLQAGTPVSLPLEEVYVELRAVAEVPEAAEAWSVEERRLLLEIEEGDADKRRELTRQLDGLRKERWGKTLPERQSIAQALHHRDRRTFVILGDPGSGKTTLLHFLTLVYARGAGPAAEKLKIDLSEADRLPIFAPLAAFDNMLREAKETGERRLALWEFLPAYYDRRRNLPGLAPLFRRALESGKALVLLDGLDEVIDVGTRGYVADQVKILADEWAPRGVRFALSSRFVGYREAAVPGSPTTLSVLDFGLPEIRVFLHQWAQVYERTIAGGESPETLRKAQEQERGLLGDVESNDSVRRLAANPLMLTMLALLRRQVGKLPHKRVLLYEAYLSTLLDSWIAARSQGARDQSLPVMDRNQAENLLMPLALWLQKEKPSGTASKFEMRDQLVAICLEEEGFPSKDTGAPEWKKARKTAEGHADRFLKEIREMTGLLVERGHDAYGFLHLTFQEYFAGRELAREDDEARWQALLPYLHDPRWREPILLCAGRLGIVESRKPQVSKLVRNILDYADPTEGDLHRDLLLALAIAGDDVGIDKDVLEDLVSRAVERVPATKVNALAKSLLEGLCRLVANGQLDLERAVGGALKSGREALVVEALEPLGHLPAARQQILGLRKKLERKGNFAVSPILSRLVKEYAEVRQELLADTESSSTLTILTAIVATDSEVFRIMVDRVEHQHSWVRAAVVRALGSLAEARPAARELLLERLKDPASDVRSAAIPALSPAAKEPTVRARLLEVLNEQGGAYPPATARALGPWVGTDPEVRQALLGVAQNPTSGAQAEALAAIGALPYADEEARQAIFLGLDSPNGQVALEAVRVLARWARVAPELKMPLLDCLQSSAAEIRKEALLGLAQAFPEDSKAVAAVSALARHRSWRTRQTVAEILGDRDGASNSLLPKVLELQLGEESARPLGEGLAGLGPLARMNTRIRQELRTQLVAERIAFRTAAIRALVPLVAENSEIREALVDKLTDPQWTVRQVAVQALGPLAESDAGIREALAGKLADPNHYVRGGAVQALGPLAESDAGIREALAGKLADPQGSARQAAVQALGPLAGGDAEIQEALVGKLADPQGNVRQAAVQALGPLAGGDAEVQEALVGKLADPHGSVRQAAVQALGPLAGREAKVCEALVENLADPQWSVRRAAVQALGPLAGGDAKIREALAGKLVDPFRSVRDAVAEALGPLAVGNSEIRNAFVGRLDEPDSRVRSTSIRALGPVAARSAEIREAIGGRLADPESDVRQAAVQALGPLIAENAEIRKALSGTLIDSESVVRQAAVQALGPLVADDSGVRTALIAMLADPDLSVGLSAWNELFARLPETPNLAVAAVEWFQNGASFDTRLGGLRCLLTLRESTLLPNEDWAGVEVALSLEVAAEYDAWNAPLIQERFATAVAQALATDPSLERRIRQLLHSPRASSRLGGILTLASWPGGPPEEVIDEIFAALKDDRDLASYPARLTAASYLINDDRYAERAIDLCLEALDYGTEPWEFLPEAGPRVRRQAALVLGKLEPVRFHEPAYAKLLAVMKQDGHSNVRDAAYNALVRLARAREEAEVARLPTAVELEEPSARR